SQSEAKAIAAAVGDQHPDLEFEIHQGDQPVYPYFVSVE
ncbi:dihydroxyacetone kinase(DAK2)-like enzyme, partial [Lacticaseibacillus rhamnosus MTCC 5462]